MQYLSEQNIFIFLIQVLLLLGLARGLGELFRRWKQPPVTAEILVGLLLGPSILGRFFPSIQQAVFPPDMVQQNMLATVAWMGLLFFLLETGLQVDFSSAWRQKGDALKIAITDIIVPMSVSFVACLFLPDQYLIDPAQRLIFAFFMATVMTISAMPITARALYDLNISKTDLGFLIVSALSVNDIIGWLIFTLVLGFFRHASLDVAGILIIVVSTVAFATFCLTLGRNFVNFVISKTKSTQISQPATSLTFICLLGLFCGAITQTIGIHALFGFFIAGIMAGEARALSERTRQVISQMVYAIFVPLFFASIGLRIDFLHNFNLLLVLFITTISILGKFYGAWLGVGFTKLSKANRLSIAIAHTPGGTMEIVIGLVALEYNLISEPVFVAIVVSGVLSAVVFGPWFSYSIKKRKEIGILEYFNNRSIIADIKATDKCIAIEELCNIAAESENMPEADELCFAVLKREDEMGTAIEEGVAVPHARFASLSKPVIVFGRSADGIEWDSPDGKPTHFIFLILTPQHDDNVQIQILALIARVMKHGKTGQEIMRGKSGQDIWNTLHKAFTACSIIKK
jgi:Kef-type K+ transport system membrane component KefB/mannitol/fructose-specific phosphotransferase system IIA component (Ntr-type)